MEKKEIALPKGSPSGSTTLREHCFFTIDMGFGGASLFERSNEASGGVLSEFSRPQNPFSVPFGIRQKGTSGDIAADPLDPRLREDDKGMQSERSRKGNVGVYPFHAVPFPSSAIL